MFKENRVVDFNINWKKFLSFNDAERRKEHNNNNTTTQWNQDRHKIANLGFLNPITTITTGISNAIKGTLDGIITAGKKTIQLASTTVLGTAAIVPNTAKWAYDNSVQLVASGGVVMGTKLGEAISWPSRILKSTNDKINKVLNLPPIGMAAAPA